MTSPGSSEPAAEAPPVEYEPDEPLSRGALWLRAGILGFDGFLVALFAVFFLPQWIGSVPFPISGLVAGAVNAGLVVLGLRLLGRSYAVAPVIGFGIGLLLCMLGGPGGDVLVPNDWRMLVLVFGGLLPPVAVLLRSRMRAATQSVSTDGRSMSR